LSHNVSEGVYASRAGGFACHAPFGQWRCNRARAQKNILRRPANSTVTQPTTMSCHNCARRTLGLFIRSIANVEPAFAPPRTSFHSAQQSRRFTTTQRAYRFHTSEGSIPTPAKPVVDKIGETVVEEDDDDVAPSRPERPHWAIQKEALKEKLGGEAWNPRKKLSPDTMEGIRHLHKTAPDKFTTPILAEHFKVSSEAIRRILKSRWQPSDEEYEARMERWNKRGERIWTNLVEMGVKPPKKWREMGVGRATGGERPKWKSDRRNMVQVRDSASDNFVVDGGDIIPVVGTSGTTKRTKSIPLTRRL
jgi:hypothetical protein